MPSTNGCRFFPVSPKPPYKPSPSNCKALLVNLAIFSATTIFLFLSDIISILSLYNGSVAAFNVAFLSPTKYLLTSVKRDFIISLFLVSKDFEVISFKNLTSTPTPFSFGDSNVSIAFFNLVKACVKWSSPPLILALSGLPPSPIASNIKPSIKRTKPAGIVALSLGYFNKT